MDPNTPKKFDLTVKIEEKKVAMIPFILNTFGNIFSGSIHDLEDVGDSGLEKQISCTINPSAEKKNVVTLQVAEKQINIKPFIQKMIWKTITGFLSTLKKIPTDLENLPITIKMQRKL